MVSRLPSGMFSDIGRATFISVDFPFPHSTISGDLVTSDLILPDPEPKEAEEEFQEKVFAPKVLESRKDINMV